MTNKDKIQAAHNYEICSKLGLSESDSSESAATSCTTITAEAIGEAMEWADTLGAYQDEDKEWYIDTVFGRSQLAAKTTAELVELFLNQKAKI